MKSPQSIRLSQQVGQELLTTDLAKTEPISLLHIATLSTLLTRYKRREADKRRNLEQNTIKRYRLPIADQRIQG